jgi:prepilin-type N-terminal cleavage/methylation domain-containing protein
LLVKRKAFTLIELLVVIAIIAILAAILFPVFAQAKAAAKKASSLSNTKQVALAELMYMTDYDDTYVVEVAWDANSPPAFLGGVPYQPWPWLVLPYQKNGDIDLDPQAPPNDIWAPAWGSLLPKLLEPQYGYSYVYLSPLVGGTPTTSKFEPTNSTAIEQPANTVMFSAKFSSSEDTLPATFTYWYGPGTIVSILGVDVPHCATIPQWCFDNWGTNGFFDATYLNRNEAAGARTGGNSLRAGNQMILTWTDGHSAAKAAGAMAAGTNWSRAQAASGVVINDINKYLWDTR